MYLADRVQVTSTTTGTGNITLGSALTGYQTFLAAFGNSPVRVPYVIDDGAGNWEVGYGTFDGSTTLTRDKVLSSSNANALVSFAAGTKNVYVDMPSDMLDGAQNGPIYATVRGMNMP